MDINQKIASLSPAKRALLELKLKNKTVSTKTEQTIPIRDENSSIPLSFAQQRLWFLEQLEPNSSFYHIPEVLQLQGTLNIAVLQQSLDAIVARHESLRTNFISLDGNPVQTISEPQSVELKIIDLQNSSESNRSSAVQNLLKNEAKRPFDLTSDLMLRGCLLQLSPQEHILLLVIHHIAADAWSMGILYDELTTLYKAFLDGQPNPLPKLPIQYADYAVWQRQWLRGEVLENQINYWKQQLAGATPVLELPTDKPRPPIQAYRGAKEYFVLPQRLLSALQKLSRQEGVTLFMTLLAAFQTLLYRYTGQEDILVGSPTTNRSRAEIEGLIGFFINTLVLRTDLSGNPTFRELLQKVRKVAISANVNQDLPFEKLVEELQPERSLSYNPLFQVMFTLNTPKQSFELPGLSIAPLELCLSTSKFDLTLFAEETEQGLRLIWEYNTDLFEQATITRMSGHLQTTLEGIVANPQQRISELPLLTETEKNQLLVEWNNTKADYTLECIDKLFEAQVERTPNAVAVEFENQQLTYRELNNRANQLAHYLQSFGVGPDVAVGICIQRSLEMVVGLLGILKAGGAYVPLDPAYPQDRLSFMLSDSQVTVLLTSEKLATALPKHNAQTICLDTHWATINQESKENLVSGVQLENLAYIIYTSGSTGKPKGVAMKQLPLCNLIFWQLENTTVSTDAKTLQFSPISFDVSFQEMFATWCSGGTLVLIAEDLRRDASALLDFLKQKEINRLFLPFVALQQLAEVAAASLSVPSSLQEIITAGEQLQTTPALINLFEKLPQCKLHNHYGPSESHVVTTFTLPDRVKNWSVLPPIGRPIANTSIYILDSNLQPVPTGVPGELYIGGVALARGYLNRPELTAEKFIFNPFDDSGLPIPHFRLEPDDGNPKSKIQNPKSNRLYKTGDLARFLPDGNIEYLGRIDNQVKIRGFRIELGELEALLSKHLSVHQAVVIVRQDIPGDKRLVAYIVPDQDSVPTVSELRSFLKEQLPEYMVPSAFVVLDTLPLTPSGKVNRRALPAPDITNLESERNYIAPRNEVEQQLAQIWEEILGFQPIGVKDNFFDIGGHSLLAVKLFSKIEKELGKKLPLATLFQSSTIEALGELLLNKQHQSDGQGEETSSKTEQGEGSSLSILVPIQPIGSKPPLFLIHPLGGEVLCYRSAAIHIGKDQPIYGIQPQGIDGKEAPLTKIEDMAALYIKAIQAIQPQGPYYLGGYSLGGTIAYEIAQQLRQQGQEIAIIIMLDSGVPGQTKRLPFVARIFLHFENLVKAGPVYISTKIRGWTQWALFHLRRKYLSFLGVVESLSQDDPHLKVMDCNLMAWDRYKYQPFSGRIAVLRTDERCLDAQDRAVGLQYDPLLGWGSLVDGEIDVYHIPGSHFTMFNEPHVREVAEKLKCVLEKVYSL
ncbi:amino acid adenylation domain-containing protein [Scytonema sp. UIC 10036]|uniref:non-ribosomal peptide synthetase n=1 Tax=Scytonema sp. UIC 10036 TaxID=2304196 RepID=UPI0012DA90C9|nr:non-ribosomal peptide synthetase [Scytonema sp. UIC 10036]MUG97805.1 amino acid adenylation domain-containing protein [Scytonema sp. UIC 10036]